MSHPVDLHVGSRLRARRGECGMTQTELAGELGLSPQQIQKYENGMNRVSASKLFEIASCLGVEIGWFFEGMAPVGLFAEERSDCKAAHCMYETTRALIAAYKALPDDDLRADALNYVQNLAAKQI